MLIPSVKQPITRARRSVLNLFILTIMLEASDGEDATLMYARPMATTANRATSAGASASQRPKKQPAKKQPAKFSAYTAALREAGVGEDDLRLLRELAEMNANDLSRAEENPRPSRVLL